MQNLNIRWMIKRDTPEVLDIEAEGFGSDAMSEKELVNLLRMRNAIGMVIEDDNEIVGYMIYMLEKTSIRLERIAVKYEREGIGTALIERLKRKIGNERQRIRLVAIIPETYLGAQLFARAMGFRCNRVSRCVFLDYFGEPTIDGYAFDWFKQFETADV